MLADNIFRITLFCACLTVHSFYQYSRFHLARGLTFKLSMNLASPDLENNVLSTEAVVTDIKENNIGDVKEGEVKKELEETFRKYPFDNISLPVLSDCNNYYSGKFGDYFWHQNADQLYVYIPIPDDVVKDDIDITFAATNVKFTIKGKKNFQCNLPDRIIPDGSFWVIEKDRDGKRYIQLDLEKRLRMINWNNLFGERPVKTSGDDDASRKEMIKRLLSANKGMSKLTGVPAETEEELMSNEQFTSMLSEIDSEPVIQDETEVDDDVVEAEFRDIEGVEFDMKS